MTKLSGHATTGADSSLGFLMALIIGGKYQAETWWAST